jgi:hypothetical protein
MKDVLEAGGFIPLSTAAVRSNDMTVAYSIARSCYLSWNFYVHDNMAFCEEGQWQEQVPWLQAKQSEWRELCEFVLKRALWLVPPEHADDNF